MRVLTKNLHESIVELNLYDMQEMKRGENLKLDKLKGKLTEMHMSYEVCAKSIGISTTSFSQKINGNSKFYVEEVKKLSELLKMTNKEKLDIFLN